MQAILQAGCSPLSRFERLAGLVFASPTGSVTIDQNHYATMNMFIARTQGSDLVTVRALGAIAPQPGCKRSIAVTPSACHSGPDPDRDLCRRRLMSDGRD